MKRLFAVTIALVLTLLCFSSCGSAGIGSPKVASEQQIIEDIKANTNFENLNLEIDKFEVIKRQTNVESKEDIVFVSITGHTDELTAVRNYELRYELYNEGWIVETVKSYRDNSHQDDTVAKNEISLKEATSYFETFDADAFAPYKLSDGYTYDIISTEIELSEYYDNNAYYNVCVTYRYDTFDAFADLEMNFMFTGSSENWSWKYPDLTDSEPFHSAVFNDGILGEWECSFDAERYTLNVKSYSSAHIVADVTVDLRRSTTVRDYWETYEFENVTWQLQHKLPHYIWIIECFMGTYEDDFRAANDLNAYHRINDQCLYLMSKYDSDTMLERQ